MVEVSASNARAKSNANLRPFRKGVSGNPTGGSKLTTDFRLRCQNFMEKEGWANIMAMAKDPLSPHQGRMQEILAAYAYGKPPQRVEQTGADGGPITYASVNAVLSDFTVDELRKLLTLAEQQQQAKGEKAHAAK